MRKAYLVSMLAGAALLIGAVVAIAASTTTTLTEKFSTKAHGKPTSVVLKLVDKGPGGKLPPPTNHDINTLPPGATLNVAGSGVTVCQYTAAQIGDSKDPNCPASSQIGKGTSTLGVLVGGFPIDEPATLTAYAGVGPKGVQIVFKGVGTSPVAKTITFTGDVTPTAKGITVDITIPDITTLPSQPNASIKDFAITIGHGKLLSTPKLCKGGKWKFTNKTSFTDGTSSTATSTQKC